MPCIDQFSVAKGTACATHRNKFLLVQLSLNTSTSSRLDQCLDLVCIDPGDLGAERLT